jgi:glycosyltransferase involved in cell wall biosynthesis
MWGLPASIASLAGRLFRAYERDCVSHFAGVVTVSNTVLSFFDGVRRDGCVVQNVPDADRFAEVGSFADRPGPPVIYTSGTHSDARNCLPTIEAMPRVLERHSDARFVFVGRYHPEGYQDQLRERAQALGVEASLTLGGLIPWEDNFRRTEQAHIGCVFYADNPNNRVTIPNRIFEYMLCGVAVLAHDFPELARIVQGSRCGLLVDSAQGRSIADGVIALLDHRDELAECGQNGRRAVFERYNFRAQCLGMTAMYERILGVKT